MISYDCSKQQQSKIKHFRKKSKKLVIQINHNIQIDKQSLNTVKKRDYWKRIYSTRNVNHKNFDFVQSSQWDKNKQICQTIQKLQILQNQKQNLLKELDELKYGAINALIQKEEQIEELKKKMQIAMSQQSCLNQDEIRLIMNQLQQSKIQIQQLKKELEMIKQRYQTQMQLKNEMICELGEQLQKTKVKFQDLKHQDEILTQKLHIIESENQQLHQELMTSQINIGVLKQSLNNSIILENEVRSQKSELIKNTVELKRFKTQDSNFSQRKYSIDYFEQEDYRIRKLQQLNRKQRQNHEKQLKKLQEFYQNKLLMIKMQYQNQLQKIRIQNNSEQNCLSDRENQSDISQSNTYSNNLKKQIKATYFKNQQDCQEAEVQTVKSDKHLKPKLRKYQISSHQSNFSINNFHYQRNELQNIKENDQLEKTFANDSCHKQKQQKLQDEGNWFTSLMKRKKQIGIIVGYTIVSNLIYGALKIRK